MQSLCWGSAAIGGLISAYFSGSLLEVIGPTDVFKITAVLPLLVASIAFFINEEPIQRNTTGSSSLPSPSSSYEDTKPGFAVEMQPGNSNIVPTLPISAGQSQITPPQPPSSSDVAETAVVDTNHEVSAVEGVSEQMQSLWKAIKEPAVWKPALFLFLWQSTPTSEGAFLYFMTNDLGFGPEFLGRVRLVTAAASLLGVWGYQKFLRGVSSSAFFFL